jgi:hypothetical protein
MRPRRPLQRWIARREPLTRVPGAAAVEESVTLTLGGTGHTTSSTETSATPGIDYEEEALRALVPDAVYYAMRLRGRFEREARRELEFRPRPLGVDLGPRSD